MTAIWPAALPRPTRDSWQSTYADGRMKKRAEAGPPGYRLRFSTMPKVVTMAIDVDRRLRGVFDDFYEVTCRYGTLPFWMPDPTTEGWPMLDENGAPILDGSGSAVLMSGQWLCLFGDTPPTETLRGIRFLKTFQITAMP